jgi:hypothetical protein
MLSVVFGPYAVVGLLASGNSDLTIRVSVAVIYTWDMALLAAIAPFGGFDRTRVFRAALPLVGVAYLADMAWYCGTGLTRLSQRVRLDKPDQRTVTAWGHVSES